LTAFLGCCQQKTDAIENRNIAGRRQQGQVTIFKIHNIVDDDDMTTLTANGATYYKKYEFIQRSSKFYTLTQRRL